MSTIRQLEPGRQPTRAQFNELAREINRIGKIRGRNGIRVSSTPAGITLIAGGGKGGGTPTPDEIRWAEILEDSTDTDNIQGSLQSRTTGITAIQATLDDDSASPGPTEGTVDIPSTAHGFTSGQSGVMAGTDNYEGRHTLHTDTTEDILVITAPFEAENFNTDMTFTMNGYGVDLHATILNSTRLDMSIPRLSEGNIVPVTQRTYDSAGTAVERWYILDIFYGSDDFWEK